MKHVVIVGGGISGLATAWFLQKYKPSLKVTLIEKSNRLGGWIKTYDQDGFLFEKGPRGFRPKGSGLKTLALAKEIGLEKELIFADAAAKKRYLWLDEKLQLFSPMLLIRCGLLSALWKEWRVPAAREDESIATFFHRRFNTTIAKTLVQPCIQGIFGGKAEMLSLRSCFPILHEWETAYGSILKGFLKSKREANNLPSLCSFKTGMESFPKALINKINADIFLSTPAFKIEEKGVLTSQGFLQADHVIAALPASSLSTLIPETFTCLNPLPFLSLTLFLIGYDSTVLKTKGFGHLVALNEEAGILGMTWDSDIFPQHNRGRQTRLCVMYRGESSKEKALPDILNAIERQLGITKAPTTIKCHVASQAIPQYPVGFGERLHLLKQMPISFIGSSFGAVGVNGCIAQAEATAQEIGVS